MTTVVPLSIGISALNQQCFQRWNRCVRFKVVRLSSLIPLDLRHAEQLLFLCPCSNLTVYKGSIFDHPLCASLSCLQYSISFGNKKPYNVNGAYIFYCLVTRLGFFLTNEYEYLTFFANKYE